MVSHLSLHIREVKVQQKDRKDKISKRTFFGFIATMLKPRALKDSKRIRDENIHSYFRLKAPGI